MPTFRNSQQPLLAGLVAVLLSGLPLAAHAAPPVEWQPDRIEITIGSGQGATEPIQATFESRQQLTDIRIDIVPALRPFVTVTPDTFDFVEANSPQTVTLDFRVPPYAEEGTYDGTIRIRQGRRTLPATLKVQVQVWYGGTQIPPTTKVLSDDTLTTLTSVSADGSTFTFNQGSPELYTLAAGDILALPISDLLPFGALRKVTEISQVGSTIVVGTLQASLEEAFEEAEIELSADLTQENVESTLVLLSGASIQEKQTVAAGGFRVDLLNQVLYDLDGSPSTTNDQIRANGSISFETGFDFFVDIHHLQIVEAKFVNRTSERAELILDSAVQVGLKKEIELARYNFSPIVIWVTWVPVVINPILTVNVGVDGSLSVGVEAGVRQEAGMEVGIGYENGEFTPIAEYWNEFDPIYPTLTIDAFVKGYGGPELTLLFYGSTGPSAEIIGYLELDASVFRCPHWWLLYGGLDVNAAWKLDVLGVFDLGEISFPGLIDLRVPLAEADRCPCYSLSVGHTGQGADPIADPTSSTGCPQGEYTAGEVIQLTGVPEPGWAVSGWLGTDGDTSTSQNNYVTMPPEDHAVTVNYRQSCFSLFLSHTGMGSDPVATPASSPGCLSGEYNSGELIELTATPDPGWSIESWSGTDNDTSTDTLATLIMPPASHSATVNYQGGGCVLAPHGMVGWWPGDGGANDIASNNHGTLRGGATFAPGKVGSSFSLDGVNDFVEISDDGAGGQDAVDELTIDLWVWPASYPDPAINRKFTGIISKWGPSGHSDDSWYIAFYGDHPTLPPGTILFAVAGASPSGDSSVFSNSVLPVGVWSLVTAVFKRGEYLRIYINGVLDSEAPAQNFAIHNTSRAVHLGKLHEDGTALGDSHYFMGLLDEVEIHNRALTSEDIESVYRAGSAGKCKGAAITILEETYDDLQLGESVPAWTPLPGQPDPTTPKVQGVSFSSAPHGAELTNDFEALRPFASLTGTVIIEVWMDPRVGADTNNVLRLQWAGSFTGAALIGKNESDRWLYTDGATHQTVFFDPLDGEGHNIRIEYRTETATFDLFFDRDRDGDFDSDDFNALNVSAGETMAGLPVTGITLNSGRGGIGTTSYFDDLRISNIP